VLATRVSLQLSDKKNNGKDVKYYNNNDDDGSPIPQKNNKSKNNSSNNDKPLAKLLVVDEALQNFQSNSKDYCLMLSDIRMPGLSGIQLARKVKEINPDIKVVLMTSFDIRDNEFSKVFPSMHVDGFVQKPIGISDLTNKILSIIRETKRRLDEN
jgi:two-component SAPR family response regulator